MTKMEKKLIFENQEFMDYLYKISCSSLTSFISMFKLYKGVNNFIQDHPKLLFLYVKEFVENKFDIHIKFNPLSKIVQLLKQYKKNSMTEYDELLITGLDYKTDWTGLLSAWEWCVKNLKEKK